MDAFEKHLDDLIPRGGNKPDCLHISLEDYISRVAMLARKISGLKHRKQCWDSTTSDHLLNFKGMTDKLYLKNRKTDKEPQNKKIEHVFHLRDTRLENEFEVFIYSLRSSLTILTKLIASFLAGRTTIHSHSKLRENLCKKKDWPSLENLINQACESWIIELTDRRDAATHYVALTATSSYSSLNFLTTK